MANAMLEDSFKSSHPDLIACEADDYQRRHNDISTQNVLHQLHNNNNSNPFAKHEETNPTTIGTCASTGSIMNTSSSLLLSPRDTTGATTSSPNRKKSVDFSLEPSFSSPPATATATAIPPKRLRQNDPWTPKQIVDAISTCISPHERLEAIQKALETFDHDVQSIHDDEMATGADAALTKHLTFLVYHAEHNSTLASTSSSSSSPTSAMSSSSSGGGSAAPLPLTPLQQQRHTLLWNDTYCKELSLTCSTLECLYRSSSNIVGASFHRMGPILLQILVHLIDGELDRRFETVVVDADDEEAEEMMLGSDNSSISSPENQRHPINVDENKNVNVSTETSKDSKQDTSHRSATLLPNVRTETRVNPDAMTPEGDVLLHMATKIVCHFARVGTNTRDIAHFPGLLRCFIRLLTVKPYECVPWEARLSALWTMANLACHTDNMQMMVCTPGLVAALVEVACRPLHPGDPLEVVMELLRSRANASKAILNLSWAPENKILLAEQATVVDLLAELTVHRQAPLLRSRTVREILVTTRRHAISALRNLAAAPRRIKMGLCNYKNGHLLDVLTDAALNDTDDSVKDLAFAAIHNLAIQDTAIQIVNHPALVLALRGALQATDDDNQDNVSASPRSHAAATLLVLERTITPDMECYETLRDLLDAVNPAIPSDTEGAAGAGDVERNDDDDSSSSEMEVVNAAEV